MFSVRFLISQSLVFLLIVLATTVCTVSGKAADLTFVDLEGGTTSWAVQPETGRVFASLANSRLVAEYDSTGREVRQFLVGADPQELLIKSKWLIVACAKSPSLHFIDLTSNETVGSLPFTGSNESRALFCSDVDNPYVYCVTGQSSSSGKISQIDVAKQTVRKQSSLYGWGQFGVSHVAMSPDGKWIVSDDRGRSSPSRADLMKVDEDEFTFTRIRDYHRSFGQLVAGPFNRYWTFGNTLYPLNISNPLREYEGAVVRIHPEWNLAVSYQNNTLYLERFSDAENVEEVSLPPSPKQPEVDTQNRRSRVAPHDVLVQFDAKNDLVFVGTQYRGYWIDLGSYAAKLQPLYIIRAPTEVTSLVGQKLKLPLAITNGIRGNNLRLMKKAGPESIQVANTGLTWTPQAADVGIQTVRLELFDVAAERILDATELKLHIELPKIDVGFQIKTMQRSPDNRFAVLWGPSPGQEDRHPAHVGSDDIAIVDLLARKLLATKSMPSGIRTATIDDKYVYVAPNSGNLFYRIDHALNNRKRHFLQSAPQQLIKFVGNRMAVTGDQLEVFDTDTMKPAKLIALTGLGTGAASVAILDHQTIRVGGQIIDRNDGKLLRVVANPHLPQVIESQSNRFQPPPGPATFTWGRKIDGNQLSDFQGNTLSKWTGGQDRYGVISEKHPMAVLVGPIIDSQTHQTTVVMEFRSLVDGTVEHSSIIDVLPTHRGRSPNFYGSREVLAVTDHAVIFVNGSELLIAEISRETAAKMPVPAHFALVQKTEIEVGGKVKIPLEVAGNGEAVTFTLTSEAPGLTLDADTGVLTVETNEIWSSFVRQNIEANLQNTYPRWRGATSPFEPAENAKRYEALTAKKLPSGKLAGFVPISAVLQDAEGQQDGIHLNVVVVGPRHALDRAVAAKRAEMKKKQEAAMEARRLAEESRKKQMEQRRAAEASVEERLAALEASVRRIEAMVKILSENGGKP